jgi:hypothetical protein
LKSLKTTRRSSRPSVAALALLGLAGFGAVAGTAAARTSTTPTTAPAPMKVYDYPYCELIPDTVANGTITEHVFNTLGFNTCPTSTFSTITEQNVIDAYNAQYPPAAGASASTSATINGRRHWVMDTIQSTGGVTSGTDTLTVNGMELGIKALLTVAVGAPTIGTVPYVVNTVQRDTVYVFKRGRRVFELVAPNKQVFVMQSYSQQVSSKLRMSTLRYIGPKDQLPTGWKYRSRVLTKKLTLTANGTTQIVNDYFRNTFQVNPAAKR